MSKNAQPGSAKKRRKCKAVKKQATPKKSPLYRAVYIPEAVFLQYTLEKRRRGVFQNARFMELLLRNMNRSGRRPVKKVKKSKKASKQASVPEAGLEAESSSKANHPPVSETPATVTERPEPTLTIGEAANTRFLRLQQQGKYDNTEDLLLHMLSLEDQYQQEVRNLLEVAHVTSSEASHHVMSSCAISRAESGPGLPSTSVVTSTGSSVINGPNILPIVPSVQGSVQPNESCAKVQCEENLLVNNKSSKTDVPLPDPARQRSMSPSKPSRPKKESSQTNDPLQKEEMAAAAALASIYQTLTKSRNERYLEDKFPHGSLVSCLSGGNYPGDLMYSPKQSSSSLARFLPKNLSPLQLSLFDFNQASLKARKRDQSSIKVESQYKPTAPLKDELESIEECEAADLPQSNPRGRGRGRGRGRPRGRKSVIRPVTPVKEEVTTRHSPRLSPRAGPNTRQEVMAQGKGRSPGRGRGRKRAASTPNLESEEFDASVVKEMDLLPQTEDMIEETENQDPEDPQVNSAIPESGTDIIMSFDNDSEFDLTYTDNPDEDPDFDADGVKPLRKRKRCREKMTNMSDLPIATPATPTTPVSSPPITPATPLTPISPRYEDQSIENSVTESLDSALLDKTLAEENGNGSSMIMKLGDRSYMCKVCGKVVNKLSTMTVHIYKVHTLKAMASFHYLDGDGYERYADVDKLFVMTEPISPEQEVQFDPASAIEWTCKICNQNVVGENGKVSHSQRHVNPTYTCVICSAVYFGERYIKNHIIDAHALRQFPCDQCTYKALHENDLENHISFVHQKAGKFPCLKCGKIFRRAPSLRLHQSKEHSDLTDGDLLCPYCGIEFEDKTSFGEHLMAAHPVDIFPCPHAECGTKWPTQKLLIRHLQNVHPDNDMRNFLCDQCGKTFKNRDDVRIHQQRVHAERNFVCPDDSCGKTFKRKAHLEVHMRIHRDEKPLQCEHCAFRCRQKNSLNWHLKKHHGIGGDLPPRKRSDSKKKKVPTATLR